MNNGKVSTLLLICLKFKVFAALNKLEEHASWAIVSVILIMPCELSMNHVKIVKFCNKVTTSFRTQKG